VAGQARQEEYAPVKQKKRFKRAGRARAGKIGSRSDLGCEEARLCFVSFFE